jgi:hypothetical protein
MAGSNVPGDPRYFNAHEWVFIAAKRLSHLREASKMSQEQQPKWLAWILLASRGGSAPRSRWAQSMCSASRSTLRCSRRTYGGRSDGHSTPLRLGHALHQGRLVVRALARR